MVTARRSRTPFVIALIAGIVLIVGLVVAGLTIGPQLIRAAAVEVAPSDTQMSLGTGTARATIPVDAGWAYGVDPFDSARATLRSPDGVMTVAFTVVHGVDAEQAARDAADRTLTPFDTESVGPATVLHARGVGDDLIAGAVVEGDTALVFVSTPGTHYDAELAALLSRIEVAS